MLTIKEADQASTMMASETDDVARRLLDAIGLRGIDDSDRRADAFVYARKTLVMVYRRGCRDKMNELASALSREAKEME